MGCVYTVQVWADGAALCCVLFIVLPCTECCSDVYSQCSLGLCAVQMWAHGVDPPSLLNICSFYVSERYHQRFSGLLECLPKALHHFIIPFDHTTEPWQHGMSL